jgi:hypothetical protein
MCPREHEYREEDGEQSLRRKHLNNGNESMHVLGVKVMSGITYCVDRQNDTLDLSTFTSNVSQTDSSDRMMLFSFVLPSPYLHLSC